MIKYNAINLFAKLDFSKLPTLPTVFVDQKNYNKISFTNMGSSTLDNNKYLMLNGSTQGIRSTTTYNMSSLYNDNIQFECHFILTSIKSSNVLFALDSNNISEFKIDVNKSGISIIYGGKKVFCGYSFTTDVDYHLLVTKDDFVYTFIVNGDPIGKLNYDDGLEFSNYINIVNSVYYTIGRDMYSTNTSNIINGKMYNINISNGVTLHKEPKAYSKYGNNLISRINLSNKVSKTTDLYPCGVDYFNYNWVYTYEGNKLKTINTSIENDFRLDFNLNYTKNMIDINIIELGDYVVKLSAQGTPEPEVVVDTFTSSALDFENGLTDKIATTIWNKEGTADITTTNVIYGDTSFETKALGDSLYTNSKILTGGTTPFTIEFYALIKGYIGGSNVTSKYAPLLSKNTDNGAGNQAIYVNSNNKIEIQRLSNSGGNLSGNGLININNNEINKFTVSYDSSALRFFVNDKLDFVLGTSIGFYSQSNLPYMFMRTVIPSDPTWQGNTQGLIDNINIFDGECRQVRDYDEYADNLVVDLSFDGENNSTKIVDNASVAGVNKWDIKNSYLYLKTNPLFNSGFSYLGKDYNVTNNNLVTNNIDLNFGKNDFTIAFEFIRNTDNQFNILWATNITNYTSQIKKMWSFCFMGTNYPNSTYKILSNRLSFFNEDYINSDTVKNKMNDPYNIPNLLISKQTLSNKIYKVSIVRKNQIMYLYINDILDNSIVFDQDIDLSSDLGLSIMGVPFSNDAGLIGSMNYFKIYKGVAVIPENPVGKIQLHFDNNLNDKYGNSTWTNNGVTFDQVNSVKGYAAYFNGDNKYITSGINDDLNYGTNDFSFEFDVKNTNVNKSKLEVVLCSGDTAVTSSTTKLQAIGVHYQSNFNGSVSQPNELKSLLIFGYFYNNIDYLQTFYVIRNVYYHYKQTRKGNALIQRVNDVITNVSNYNLSLPININNNNNTVMGKCLWRGNDIGTNINSQFDGYIDNFKSIKDYKENVIIDKPAVHLPLETNATNIGFTDLTVNSVGSPTYTTVDNKKCIKFEQGKYLRINSNNIFNLGTNSDFYMELDFYKTSGDQGGLVTDFAGWSNGTTYITAKLGRIYFDVRFDVNSDINQVISTNTFEFNTWNNVKIYRKGTTLYIDLNGVITTKDFYNYNIQFAKNSSDTCIGTYGGDTANTFNGYLTNFKMFVGTSEIPESYNDKKVLDLDFKPTGKSYLFKDNNNKCIIHPVNITQRDYQDSQYCCTFNGTNQYLQLGKNDLFNFGYDDFVIQIKFKSDLSDPFNMLITGKHDGGSSAYRSYFGICGINHPNSDYRRKLTFDISGTSQIELLSNTLIEPNTIYTVILKSTNKTISMSINGIDEVPTVVPTMPVNFNFLNSTAIGFENGTSNSADNYFNGTIYSIKVLRNTTDLTLLEDVSSGTEIIKYDIYNNDILSDTIVATQTDNNISLIREDKKHTLVIDGESSEVTLEENDNVLTIYNDNTTIDDVKLYNKAFYDTDDFIDPGLSEIGYPGINIEESKELNYQIDNLGDYTIKGFIEGYTDRKYQIINTLNDYILTEGIEDYEYYGIDFNYIDEYKIKDLVSNETYSLYTHEMIKGYISGKVDLVNCGVKSENIDVYCYRNDNQRLIGIYKLDSNSMYVIPNLDVNSFYDIVFKDRKRKIENISSSYRQPVSY